MFASVRRCGAAAAAARLLRGGVDARGGHAARASPPRALSTISQDDIYDVVIVGGGMVGSAVAAGLASSRLTSALRVAVIDAMAPDLRGPEDLPAVPHKRVSSVSPGSSELFKAAGVWDQLLAPPLGAPFSSMQVWDSLGSGYVRYEASEVGEDVLGWVIENDLIQGALVSCLERAPNTELLWPEKVTGIRLPGRRAEGGRAAVPAQVAGPGTAAGGTWSEVDLEGGRTLHARLLVGADGGRSRVREAAGLRTVGMQYGQRGVVATVRMESQGGEGHSTAWQRFLPRGPLALLPSRNGYMNIVWSTSPTEAKRLEGLSGRELAEEVNVALSGSHAPPPPSPFQAAMGRLSRGPAFQHPPIVQEAEPAQSFPLAMSHTGRYVLPRLALVGDAAHTVHPLAGQGVNLGFADAKALVEAVKHGVASGRDIGSIALLEEYEAKQKRTNMMMMAGVHGLQRLFGAGAPPLAMARNLGLDMVNMSGPLKKQIVRYAMMGEAPTFS